MKKLLGMALILALVIPATWSNAEILKNIKVGGSVDLQANSADNITNMDSARNDRIGDVVTRVLLNTSWDLLDDMHANITLRKNDRAWGTTGAGGQKNNGDQGLLGLQTNSSALDNTMIGVANIKVDKLAGNFDATIGRQTYGDPGDLIVYYGPKTAYGLYATAIDGFRVDWANDSLGFTGIAAKTTGNAIATVGTGKDVDMRGIELMAKNLPVKLGLRIYNAVKHMTGAGTNPALTPNDNLWVYGLKAKAEGGGGWFQAQIAMNSGENRNIDRVTAGTIKGNGGSYTGKALMVDAGYKADVSNVGAFTPWVNFGYGTGRKSYDEGTNEGFTDIASGYAPGIINGRFNAAGPAATRLYSNSLTGGTNGVDTLGLNNRVVYGLGVKVTPTAADKLVAGIGFWDYRFQAATDDPSNLNGQAFESALKNKHIGSEIGLTVDWKHSENVMYGVGLAKFMPGGFIKETARTMGAGNNPATLAFADLSLKF